MQKKLLNEQLVLNDGLRKQIAEKACKALGIDEGNEWQIGEYSNLTCPTNLGVIDCLILQHCQKNLHDFFDLQWFIKVNKQRPVLSVRPRCLSTFTLRQACAMEVLEVLSKNEDVGPYIDRTGYISQAYGRQSPSSNFKEIVDLLYEIKELEFDFEEFVRDLLRRLRYHYEGTVDFEP